MYYTALLNAVPCSFVYGMYSICKQNKCDHSDLISPLLHVITLLLWPCGSVQDVNLVVRCYVNPFNGPARCRLLVSDGI
jgi:hypothetical protein